METVLPEDAANNGCSEVRLLQCSTVLRRRMLTNYSICSILWPELSSTHVDVITSPQYTRQYALAAGQVSGWVQDCTDHIQELMTLQLQYSCQNLSTTIKLLDYCDLAALTFLTFLSVLSVMALLQRGIVFLKLWFLTELYNNWCI